MITKTMNRVTYFFLLLVLVTLTVGIAKSKSIDSLVNKPAVQNYQTVTAMPSATAVTLLPDEDSTYLNTILSLLGGFGGSGLLLVFLLRRLVISYDNNFAKWETRCNNHTQQTDGKNDKIIYMIDGVQETTQELKVEIIKLQANSVDKDTVTEALTKVAMLEDDVEQVRGEVTSIMSHLLNKSRAELIS